MQTGVPVVHGRARHSLLVRWGLCITRPTHELPTKMRQYSLEVMPLSSTLRCPGGVVEMCTWGQELWSAQRCLGLSLVSELMRDARSQA